MTLGERSGRTLAKVVLATAALTGGIFLGAVVVGAGADEKGDAREAKVWRLLERSDGDRNGKSVARSTRGDSSNAGSMHGDVFRLSETRYPALGDIEIPRIHLKARFFGGVHDDILRRGPGHWPGTSLPGERGNSVLSGHRTTYTHPFGDLDKLGRGDVIRTRLRRHESVAYRVKSVKVVPEERYVGYVLRAPDHRRRMLTLFACHPRGYRTHRIVLKAVAQRSATGASGLGERSPMSRI